MSVADDGSPRFDSRFAAPLIISRRWCCFHARMPARRLMTRGAFSAIADEGRHAGVISSPRAPRRYLMRCRWLAGDAARAA